MGKWYNIRESLGILGDVMKMAKSHESKEKNRLVGNDTNEKWN